MSDRLSAEQSRSAGGPLRWVIGIVIGVICTAMGVYLGAAAVQRLPATEIIPGAGREPEAEKLKQAGIYLEFEEGDPFPMNEVVVIDDAETTFSEIAGGGPLALMFIDPECDRCLDLLKYCNSVVDKLIRPEVKVAVCIDTSVVSMPPQYTKAIGNKTVIRYPVTRFQRKFHLDFYPTIVTVDNEWIVTAIQFGMGRRLREDLLETICDL